MDDHRHQVSGFYERPEDAAAVLETLVARGLPRERLHLSTPPAEAPAKPAGSQEVLKDVLVDGAIGTAVGTGLGAVAQLALVAANVSLFVASPLIAPLAMLGWGAGLGGFLGAAVGAAPREGRFADLVRDAIASGQVVLIADTRSADETRLAEDVIGRSVAERMDVDGAPVVAGDDGVRKD